MTVLFQFENLWQLTDQIKLAEAETQESRSRFANPLAQNSGANFLCQMLLIVRQPGNRLLR